MKFTSKHDNQLDTRHASHGGRRVAERDRALIRLIEFANLMTPVTERRSPLRTLNEISHRVTVADLKDFARRERLRQARRSATPDDALVYPDRGMDSALAGPWIAARKMFGHPRAPHAVTVPVPIESSGTEFHLAMDVVQLIETIWIVRATLWRIALAHAHQDRSPFVIGVPSGKIYAGRDRITVGADGRISIEYRDISAALLSMLSTLDLSRVRICRAQYRRTRSRCCRLFLALRKDQKECSRQCADLRRHNEVRHGRSLTQE
jgi:hypothetical protein